MYQLTKNGCLNKLIETTDPTIATARRQDLPKVYTLNGALYFANIDYLRKNNTFVTDETIGFIMSAEKSIDIDTPLDLKLAELLLS